MNDSPAVYVPYGRYGGTRLATCLRTPEPALPVRARKLGLETRADAQRLYQQQQAAVQGDGTAWSGGPGGQGEWYCPIDDRVFLSRFGALKHRSSTGGHPVLRVDQLDGWQSPMADQRQQAQQAQEPGDGA